MTKQIPVYLFIGFLESGKTRVIQETMEDPNFNNGEKTLILQCEEGEEELDLSCFAGQNVRLQTIEREEDLTAARLVEWQKKNPLDRVIIEYNGMWAASPAVREFAGFLVHFPVYDVRRCDHFPGLQYQSAIADGG